MTPLPLKILGLGMHDPACLVHSSELDARFGRPLGWAERLSGVRARRFVGAGETASAMAEGAARRALDAAGLAPSDLSAVLGASAVMEQPIPGTSVLVHARLGLGKSGVVAFDINATCLSFLTALHVAALHIGAGLWSNVLIVASDVASAALDPDDPATATLFGDGAAAVVVGRAPPGEASALLAWGQQTYSEGLRSAWLGAGGSRLPARSLDALLAEATFRMDGALAYRVAAKYIDRFVTGLLADAGLTLADIDLVAPHQGSGHALKLMTHRLGLDPIKVIDILADHGNQVAASMPTALAWAVKVGRLRRGERLLLLGTAAGVSLGGAALIY